MISVYQNNIQKVMIFFLFKKGALLKDTFFKHKRSYKSGR
ncbi:hypothetical protein CHCC20331_1142 [Bacillus paralicheniformis]|uniref:Uncharacterized protein n=1 Tax=Bacillus paralicheniformis TaxID=1648923 RepID=A0A6I7TJ61_9BACI|nr:hypothetical protein B4121_0797 [Bacillus paralicheniformis]TWJ57808.1 hypothetical protein CHCC5022_4277 [Bacillus paralicheniformis]TWJ66087.1 hypothetical protein CHCC5021_0363 [Bacillus paralicheniformis]TWJ82267.1 hypothetical protein CHCC4186_1928 [Bacillus paralicheniformis]TWK23152.1 hypothetical protein CHCC20372_3559 [Bacillus paralicheniformis]